MTGNDANKDYNEDPRLDGETNVGRMQRLYDSRIKPQYASGVGTSGGMDNICLATGCGIDNKQNEAATFLRNTVDNKANDQYLFFPIDIIDFSRGATTGSDFINKINNENYWQLGLLPRSHLMFDPVGSYQMPGNGIDIGRDFSTPKNIIAIQINAGKETRNLFDLQSLYTSTYSAPTPSITIS